MKLRIVLDVVMENDIMVECFKNGNFCVASGLRIRQTLYIHGEIYQIASKLAIPVPKFLAEPLANIARNGAFDERIWNWMSKRLCTGKCKKLALKLQEFLEDIFIGREINSMQHWNPFSVVVNGGEIQTDSNQDQACDRVRQVHRSG